MAIQTFDSSENLIFDSDLVRGGICVGQFSVPKNLAWSKSFSLLQGATLRAVISTEYGTNYPGVGNGPSINNSGSPSVTLSSYPLDRSVLIWASGTPTIQTSYGIQAFSNEGYIALSPSGRGLNYIGKATYHTLVPRTVNGPDTDIGYWKIRIESASLPVAVVDMSGGIYLMSTPTFKNIGGNTWEGQLTALINAATGTVVPVDSNYATPDVFCFAAPTTPSGAIQFAIYDTDGTLAYDLMAGRLLASSATVTIPASELLPTYPVTSTRSLPSLGKYGLYGYPDYWRIAQRTSNSSSTRSGFWRVSGTTLSITSHPVQVDSDSGSNVDTEVTSSGAYAEILDLTGY